MAPLVYKDLIIEGNALDSLTAFNRHNGNLVWRKELRNGVEGGAIISGDRLYFGSSDGFFYCVALSDGHEIWNFPVRA